MVRTAAMDEMAGMVLGDLRVLRVQLVPRANRATSAKCTTK
ncbi:unnamed protein product, partial [marine sediment metagenome]